MSYVIRDCPVCGGQDLSRDFHYNLGEYSLLRCMRCSLGFLDRMYDDAELSEFYPQDYYAFADHFSENGPSPLKKLFKTLLGLREYQPKDPKFEAPGRSVDVGCGSGWFLCKMREQGWEVKGVELNQAAAKLGISKQALDIFPGSLEDAGFPSGSFDYVRFNHSFEHVSDPNRILDETHRILANHGKWMSLTPTAQAFREASSCFLTETMGCSHRTATLARVVSCEFSAHGWHICRTCCESRMWLKSVQ